MTVIAELKNLVATDFERVNSQIRSQLQSQVARVENITDYITRAGGKRLRPLLTLLSAKLCGYDGDKHIDLAVAIEFIHTATLLHDDVVDLSELRRGLPTVNHQWNNASSVLVGDFIYSRAFQLLVGINHMPVMALMAETTNQLAEGEVLQLSEAGNINCSEAIYFDIIQRKTAILFAAALKSSALIAQASQITQQTLYDYGIHLGLAYQLTDDVLDYQGDKKNLGKNIGDDLAEGKMTLPLIHLIATHPEHKSLLLEAIDSKESHFFERIAHLLDSHGSLTYTQEQAKKQSALAQQTLKSLAPTPTRDALNKLAKFAVTRIS